MSVRLLLSDLLGLVRLGLFNLTVFKTCRVNTDCLWGSGWIIIIIIIRTLFIEGDT